MRRKLRVAALSLLVLGTAYGSTLWSDDQAAALRWAARELALDPAAEAALEELVAKWSARPRWNPRADAAARFGAAEFDAASAASEWRSRLREFDSQVDELAADMGALHRALTPDQRARVAAYLQGTERTGRRWAGFAAQ